MKTIAVRLKKLTDTKEARLRELQERFSKLVLEAMTFCPPDAGEKALLQGVRRELLEMGLPERYALAGAVQAARLLREWSGVQSRPDPRRLMRGCIAGLVQAGVAPAVARQVAEELARDALAHQYLPPEDGDEQPGREEVLLTVHPLDYQLEASRGLENFRLLLRTPERDWMVLHLDVLPRLVPDMSRVWGFMQLRPGDGRWYALFRVYETRPRQWVVPLHIRAGGVS
jgi:hypothetical protein